MRSMSIQWKISLLAGSCLLLSTAAMTGVALYSASHSNQQVVAQSSQELKDNAPNCSRSKPKLNPRALSAY